ncbi:MAG: DEDD exonuclease domain-containing protein [Propionibacteriaceae bacterium]|jgi:DNA polymerase-3 subunit epsilon|nr:DEDD exonuclease domain-containing protein [Propionibacteriaceae bacterium]
MAGTRIDPGDCDDGYDSALFDASAWPMSDDESGPADADEVDEGPLTAPLSHVRFCVIDLETTGTGLEARITEIGAVKVCGGEVLGTFQTLINPGESIPQFITSLTGISDLTVADAPRLRQVFASLVEFCRGCVMVAHNARFDMGFIHRAAIGLGYSWPSNTVVDTVSLARRVIPRSEVSNYRLGTLAQYFSTTISPSHRALDDAMATVDLLHGLFERIGNRGVRTLEDLLQYSATITKARRAKKTWADGLPHGPGVYWFVRDDQSGRKVLYVGTSKHIRRRVATYFTASESRRRMEEMVSLATGVEALRCHTALEAAVVELRLIVAHQPPYNRRSKQPRHVWVKLTREPLPRFSVVRQVLDDQASYFGPFPGAGAADEAVLAMLEAFPLRRCKDRLALRHGREPCALAQMEVCGAPCTLQGLPQYEQLVDQARQCLAGDARPVSQACHRAMRALSSQCRFEEAGEILQRLRWVEYGLRRQARLTSLAACPQIVAARQVDQCWEIHVIRHAQLAGAGVARPGDDPHRISEAIAATAKTVEPPVGGIPASSIEEAGLIASWLEQPGVRLIQIDGTWGWPINTLSDPITTR